MFRKVLVPLDCSELSESALVPLHRLLAKAEGARATLLHVLPEGLSGDERRRAKLTGGEGRPHATHGEGQRAENAGG